MKKGFGEIHALYKNSNVKKMLAHVTSVLNARICFKIFWLISAKGLLLKLLTQRHLLSCVVFFCHAHNQKYYQFDYPLKLDYQ